MQHTRSGCGKRPVVLHLAVEYNNPMKPPTTTAIEWFVDELNQANNVVISLERVSNPFRTYFVDLGEVNGRRLFAYGFFGLPLGVGLWRSMHRVARKVLERMSACGIEPEVVHAHKLTFEGIAGSYIAKWKAIPLFISIRGEVEAKVLRFKPTYKWNFQRIIDQASRIYYVSAWFRDELRGRFSVDPAKERWLPNFVKNTRATITSQSSSGRFVSVFNLDVHRRKGLHWLLPAFARLIAKNPELQLDIIGGGAADSVDRVKRMISAHGLTNHVRLLGPMSQNDLLPRLPLYAAMLLPSVNETFGMVYLEALFAGIPILYTRNTGIDGFLDGLQIGVATPGGDVSAIADAIENLMQNNETYRTNIKGSASVLFERFDKNLLTCRYLEDLCAVTATSVGPD